VTSFEAFEAMMDAAAIGRVCRSGETAHDGLSRISAPEIRALRDAGLVDVLAEAPDPCEVDPDEPGQCRARVGAYDPDLGIWIFAVRWAGRVFLVHAKERGGTVVFLGADEMQELLER
jgi:hypothetical protein